MTKTTRKFKASRRRPLATQIEKEGGFDSLEMTPREVEEHEEKNQKAQNH